MRRRLGLAVLFMASGLALTTPAAAQLPSGFEQIHAYDVELVVQSNGDLRVTETIDYDFGSQSRRGIFRDIPVRFRYDDRYDRVYPVRAIGVRASRGASAKTKVSDIAGGMKQIRIGDEDTYITGRHEYVISYTVEGALNRFSDHDELFWNAIGTSWSVPIGKPTVTVRAEDRISRVACYAGPEGSRLPCATARSDGTTATFSHGSMQSYEGLSVVVALPPRSVDRVGPILDERWSADRAFSRSGTAVGGSLALLALGLLGLWRLVWRTGRDRRFVGEIPGLEPGAGVDRTEELRPAFTDAAGPVEYAPPPGMTPALMGVLLDERADVLDVTASIVDLAVRRHLRIDELPRQGLFRRRDWQLTRLDGPDDLLPWENQLLAALFKSAAVVRLSDLKNTFYADLAGLRQTLYADVVRQGWFRRDPETVRTMWRIGGVVVAVLGVGITIALAKWTYHGLLGLPVVLCGLLLVGFARWMPARTGAGSAALARSLGFRRYLATAEANQLRFEEQEGIFARYLPYAIVLGEVDRWAKAFEGLGEQAERELYWYSGPHGWTSHDFADSMSSFSSSASGTLTSTPGSSGRSGFGGGGGFSGGGGGGGGGGSW